MTPPVETVSAFTNLEFLKTLVENSFMAAAGIFTALFMLIVSILLFKGMTKLDLKGLFTENPGDRFISNSKFWSNIAYFVSTIAFLAINIAAPGAASLEFIWVVYLGVVGASAAVHKFLSLRYSAAGMIARQEAQEAQEYEYSDDRPSRARRRRNRTIEDRDEEPTHDPVRELPEGYSDR